MRLSIWATASQHRLRREVETLHGSCLCGGVRFDVTEPFLRRGPLPLLALPEALGHVRAHAGARARARASGSSPARSSCRVYRPGDDAGEGLLHGLRLEPLRRHVARRAGDLRSASGAFDDDPGFKPQFHTWVDSTRPWEELSDDGLPPLSRESL